MKLKPPIRKFLILLIAALSVAPAGMAQIVNRLKVDDPTFQRYAFGRMQLYNPDNLLLADSLYTAGMQRDNFRYKCLSLSLEFPVRFAQGDYSRMDEAVAEIKTLLHGRADCRAFYYNTIHEYCQYLIHIGRASDAMLEARAMERMASREKNALGRMYSCRIIGMIQRYRSNSYLAIENFNKAAEYCKEAKAEQELPNLYILISQEYTRMREFEKAEEFCSKAQVYQDFFPSLRIKVKMARAYIFNAQQDWNSFWKCYDELLADPLYKMQTGGNERCEMDVCYLQSKGLLDEALAKADSLGTAKDRHDKKHGIYASQGKFSNAYAELTQLMSEKDSIYIKVQNEDLAILDAEMNNAKLRQEAARLKAQNQNTILIGFIVMFAIAFFSILLSQWQLRQNLDEMKQKNNEMLIARRAYQKALDSKEAENSMRVKILQNRKSNTIKL